MARLNWLFVFFFSGALLCAAQDQSSKTWTIAGKRIDATFQSISDGKIRFKDADGNELLATFDDLPINDQQAVMKASGWGRVWTDATGKHKTIAELVKIDGKQAVLQKLDGTRKSVPFDRLSAVDRKYVEQQREPLAKAEADAAKKATAQAEADAKAAEEAAAKQASMIAEEKKEAELKAAQSEADTAEQKAKTAQENLVHDASLILAMSDEEKEILESALSLLASGDLSKVTEAQIAILERLKGPTDEEKEKIKKRRLQMDAEKSEADKYFP